jgi:hypothetical protein
LAADARPLGFNVGNGEASGRARVAVLGVILNLLPARSKSAFHEVDDTLLTVVDCHI